MARKTISHPNKRLHQTRRRRLRVIPAPAIKSHRFISSMEFDGNTLVTRSQKDDEPEEEQIYTIKQLEEELPIGKELIDLHLDGNIPRGLHHKHKKPMFNNVLLHPADLGLLAPKMDVSLRDKRRSLRRRRRQQQPRSVRRLRDDDDMRLMVNDVADDATDIQQQQQQPRNLFDLP